MCEHKDYKPDPNITGVVKTCKCNHKVLVETAMNGTVSMGSTITCWDCLNEKQKEAVREYYGYKGE